MARSLVSAGFVDGLCPGGPNHLPKPDHQEGSKACKTSKGDPSNCQPRNSNPVLGHLRGGYNSGHGSKNSCPNRENQNQKRERFNLAEVGLGSKVLRIERVKPGSKSLGMPWTVEVVSDGRPRKMGHDGKECQSDAGHVPRWDCCCQGQPHA